MKIFLWLVFLFIICVAIFAIQNSTAATVGIKFLVWKFETSLAILLLGGEIAFLLEKKARRIKP